MEEKQECKMRKMIKQLTGKGVALLLLICILIGINLFSGCYAEEDATIPVVKTGVSTVYIESMTVSCSGYVENDGGSSVFARGICYLKGEGEPTIADKTESGGSGKGSFLCNIQLNEAGAYRYRAYATNSIGTAYGETKSFVISNGTSGETNLPTVITGNSSVDNDNMTASCNGYVENDGGASVYSRGICYVSGTGKPTIADRVVSGGNGLGNYSCTLNIESSGMYSYRAYATNSSGTSYGDVRTFSIVDYSTPPVGSASYSFGNNSWIDVGPYLIGPLNYSDYYFDSWFHLISIIDSLDYNYMVSICIANCSVNTYCGHAVSGSGTLDSSGEGWSFDTDYDVEGFFSILIDDRGGGNDIEWHAKNFTIIITQYDKVAKLGSMAMEAVMYNCNNAFTPEGGNVGLEAAQTKFLRVVANQVPFTIEDDKMFFSLVQKKEQHEIEQMIKKHIRWSK